MAEIDLSSHFPIDVLWSIINGLFPANFITVVEAGLCKQKAEVWKAESRNVDVYVVMSKRRDCKIQGLLISRA